MPSGFPRVGRKTSVLLGILVALAVLIVLFDWNWVRHPLERYLSKTSQREVRIGDLHVDLGFSLQPTVRLRDVYIENASWADKRPFAEAKEATFTFSLRSVWEGRPVIYRLVLIDAKVDLERQADGLRNWRLRQPEDRGPGRVRLQSLEPHRTTIRFARRDVDLDITATATPSSLQDSGLTETHPLRIQFDGEFRGKAFSGDVVTGPTLTLLDTQHAFALRGHASTAKTRLEADGTIADLFHPSTIDAQIHLAGPSLAQLQPFLSASLPASRPYELQSRVRQTQDDIAFADLRGRLGRSDLSGEFSIVRGHKRPMLRATLHSAAANFEDFLPVPAGDRAPKPVSASPSGARASSQPPAAQTEAASGSFDGQRLQALDARINFSARRFSAAPWPAVENLRVAAKLADGVLNLEPIELRVAGGHVAGTLELDGRQKMLLAHAQLDLKSIELERLLKALHKQAKGAGPVDGRVNLKGHGQSIADFLSSASGTLDLSMQSGGISNLLDAKLGLNGGKMLRLLVSGDRAIGINNARAGFEFDKGRGRSKMLELDTDQTHTEGNGIIDLRDQTVDILLKPHPKKRSVLALHKSIRIRGPIQEPKISLESKDAVLQTRR